MKIYILLFAIVLASTSGNCLNADLVWNGSSGLFPDQVGYELVNTSSPEVPLLVEGVLTLGNDVSSEAMFYQMVDAALTFAPTTIINFRMRFVTGGGLGTNRAGSAVVVSTSDSIGLNLYIGADEVFMVNADDSRGPANSTLDTNDAFHDYQLRIDGLASGSAVSLFQDGNLVLSGSTNNNSSIYGNTSRIGFGEFTILASGTSEWQNFSHNAAAVPEPSTMMPIAMGILSLIAMRRSRK